MNKLFNKIAAGVVGIAMAIGVGVAIGSGDKGVRSVKATTVTYQHVFNAKPGTGSNISLSSVNWTVSATNLGNYNSGNYAGVQVGASSKTADFEIESSSNWGAQSGTYFGKTVVTEIRLWLNAGATGTINTLTASVGGVACTPDTTSITKNSSAGSDWTKATKITFAIGATNTGKVDIHVGHNANRALYICCVEIDCEESGGSTPTLSLDIEKTLDCIGHDFELQATASHYTPSSWAWTSSDEDVAIIDDFDEDYAVISPVGVGTTTITVSAPNGATPMTKTCDVTITSKSGLDANNPLTVDDAILIAYYTGTTATETSYYCEGIVDSLYSSKYPMLQGTDIEDDLEVYVDYSATVFAGDTIRIYGTLKNFAGNNFTQPEFLSGTTVTVINIPVVSVSATCLLPISTDEIDVFDNYLDVTVNGTNNRDATNQGWKVTSSSDTSIIDVDPDGKTFMSGSTAGTTVLTIVSDGDNTKSTTLSVTTIDASTPVLQSVTVGGTPTKATQYVGQEFDWSGLTFTPVYSPEKSPVESIDGDDIEWEDLVAGEHPTGTYTGDDDVSVTVSVSSVSVEADGVYAVYVSSDMTTKSYDEKATWDYTGLVAKVTYKSDHETQVAPTSAVTWSASSTPEQLGVGTNKSVNVFATVDGITSSAYQVTDITITEHQQTIYGLYSGTLVEGDYIITHNSQIALTNELAENTNYIGYTDIESDVSEDTITDPDSSIVWHIAASGDYWTIYNEAETNYAASTGAKNKGQVLASPVAAADTDKTLWSCSSSSSSETYEFINKQNTANSVNANLRYNSGYGFACYSTSTGSALSLYKKDYTPAGPKVLDYLSQTGTLIKTSYYDNEPFDPTGLEIWANYTDSTTYPAEDVTSSVVWDSLVAEHTSVTGSYTLGEVTETITISGITVTAAPSTSYTKISSAEQLWPGQELLITNVAESATGDVAAANHFVNGGNNVKATTYSQTSNVITTAVTSNVYVLGQAVYDSDSDGVLDSVAWTLFDGTYYLYNASTSESSYLKGKAALDTACYWNITLSDGIITLESVNNANRKYVRFNYNNGNSLFSCYLSGQADITFYVKDTNSDGTSAAQAFADTYMHMSQSTTGQCNTYYPIAKVAWGALSSDAKAKVASTQTAAYTRLQNWAAAHHETINGSYQIVAAARISIFGTTAEETNNILIITIVAIVSVTAVGGYFLLKKKKTK